MSGWNEGHVEGPGLVLEVFEASGGAGGDELEGLLFVVGLPGGDHPPDDSGQVDSLAPARSALRPIPFAAPRATQVCAPATMPSALPSLPFMRRTKSPMGL